MPKICSFLGVHHGGWSTPMWEYTDFQEYTVKGGVHHVGVHRGGWSTPRGEYTVEVRVHHVGSTPWRLEYTIWEYTGFLGGHHTAWSTPTLSTPIFYFVLNHLS